jgi:ribosomal protein L32
MTIHEHVESDYMKGWHIGAMPEKIGEALVEHYKPKGLWTNDMARGFQAGRNCAEIAERVERERLERCPKCGGDGMSHRLHPEDPDCPSCGGTGRRSVS